MAPQTYALKERRPPELPAKVELTEVPFFPQDDYYCGPSSLAMAVNAAGVKVIPDDLVDQVYLPGRKGSLQVEMLAAARRHGLIAYEIAPKIDDLLRELAAGTPAIVLENFGFHAIDEMSTAVDGGKLGHIQRFVLELPTDSAADVVARATTVQRAIDAVMETKAENDAFNELVVSTGLEPYAVTLFRALFR